MSGHTCACVLSFKCVLNCPVNANKPALSHPSMDVGPRHFYSSQWQNRRYAETTHKLCIKVMGRYVEYMTIDDMTNLHFLFSQHRMVIIWNRNIYLHDVMTYPCRYQSIFPSKFVFFFKLIIHIRTLVYSVTRVQWDIQNSCNNKTHAV